MRSDHKPVTGDTCCEPTSCPPVIDHPGWMFIPQNQDAEKAHSFICVVSVDQENYQTLFGALDNCFLVAYAIGMFIRFVCAFTDSYECFCLNVCVYVEF